MKFGAAIWPFRWDPPYEDQIIRIARLGFKAVELIVWNRESFEYYSPTKVKELRLLIDSEGLEVSQFVHTPWAITNPDASERDAAVETFRKAVDIGAALGATFINSVPSYPFAVEPPKIVVKSRMQTFSVSYPEGADWTDNWLIYVDCVRQCTSIVEAAGLRYTLEPHPFSWVSNAAGMLRLIEHVGSPHLGMNFDPSHLFAAAEIAHSVIYQLGPRVFNCHFSDNDGTTNVHWRPGKGKIDWQAVLRALSDVGFDGNISIELEDVPGVARGVAPEPGLYRNITATEEFALETVAAVHYIRGLAATQGLEIEWAGKQVDDSVRT